LLPIVLGDSSVSQRRARVNMPLPMTDVLRPPVTEALACCGGCVPLPSCGGGRVEVVANVPPCADELRASDGGAVTPADDARTFVKPPAPPRNPRGPVGEEWRGGFTGV